MIKIVNNILNVKESDTFESVPVVVGDSAYEIALRHGYKGTGKGQKLLLTDGQSTASFF